MSPDALIKSDRAIILAGLAAIVAVAWAYMVHEARVMAATGVCQCLGMQMSGPDMEPWGLSQLVPLFLMWAEMMVAMMLPSAAPMILTFAAVNRRRREQERPFVPTGVFVAGYLVVWTVFSAAAALAQWILHGTALLSPMMVTTSNLAGGLTLIGAGVFQWTPWKHACLAHCRSPLSFLMADWREGTLGAFMTGLRHGAYCTGCCWLLMALLFVVGVMNMWWIAAVSVLVLLEKVVPKGLALGRATGALLCAWGAWMIAAGA